MVHSNQEKEMTKYYHGQGDVALQVGEFMARRDKYKETQTLADIHSTGSMHNAAYVIETVFHQHDGKVIVVGQNLTSEMVGH